MALTSFVVDFFKGFPIYKFKSHQYPVTTLEQPEKYQQLNKCNDKSVFDKFVDSIHIIVDGEASLKYYNAKRNQ